MARPAVPTGSRAGFLTPLEAHVSDASRRTVRTFVQAFIGFCALVPLLIATLPDVAATTGAVAVALAVSTTVTRIMCIPAVDDWLWRFIPWLATEGGN